MAYVYILKITTFPNEITDKDIKMVSIERRNRIRRYKFIQDSYRSLLAAVLVRYGICIKTGYHNEDLIFGTSEYGKPYLKFPSMDPVYFNFSHSGKYIVCAVDNDICGVDVESTDNYSIEIAKHAFYSEELLQLEKYNNTTKAARYFTFLWTMKEAYTKALGVGLSKSLSSFYISKDNNKISVVDFQEQDKKFSVYESKDIDDNYTISFVGNSTVSYYYINDLELMDYVKDWNS